MTFNPNQIMNYQSIYTKSPGEQITTTTLQVVSGSEITYQPAIHSNFVVYELSFTQDYYDDGTCRANYYLESGSLGGSFSEVEGCLNNFGFNDAVAKDIKNLMFIVPSWEGTKSLRLSTDCYDSDRQVRLHRTAFWEGSSNTTKVNSVSLEVFSIRNQ